jgi:hypothetical protein
VSPTVLAIAALLAVIIILVLERKTIMDKMMDQEKEYNDSFRKHMELWHMERQELLDRITAENFREYKTQQIKMTRAQSKTEPEHPAIELL